MENLVASFLGNNLNDGRATIETNGGHDSGCSFVTLLTNDSFFPGVTALCKSLRATSSAFPICILVGPQVSESSKNRLQTMCDSVIEVDVILNPYKCEGHEASWTNSELTKLHIWNLTQFRKIVYVDADVLILENIDELFHISSKFAAAPDIFPPDKFNAGVMVIEPDSSVFKRMRMAVGALPSHDNGDTGFLNSFFDCWYSGPAESRLSFGYNAQRTLHWFTYSKQTGYWDSIKPLKIIHYSSSPKPWEVSPNGGNLGELEWIWWRMYMGV